MRIALVSTLGTPVRQVGSGSIESMVWLLAETLIRRGHTVTIFAAPGSVTRAEHVAAVPGTYARAGAPDDWQLCEWINLCRAVEESRRFDVLHSHAYLFGLPLALLSRAPMVHTLHIQPDDGDAKLRALMPDARVTAISRFQWSAYAECPPSAVIYHGVDGSQFSFQRQADDYLCFLGRFTPEKGPLEAIAAAKAIGLPLIMAGPENAYFRERIAPLVDGRSLRYLGPVGGTERERLLGRARALVYPIQQPEPFGLVMVEAMTCGTPVAAMRYGAVAEIVDDGITGYSASTASEFCDQLSRALTLDRCAVRDHVLKRFSAERMADQYLEVYEAATEGRALEPAEMTKP